MTISYSIPLQFSITGSAGLEAYTVSFTSNIAATVDVINSSGTVSVVVAQGRLIMNGRLINLSTNPQVTLSYSYLTRKIGYVPFWRFCINPYSFNTNLQARWWLPFSWRPWQTIGSLTLSSQTSVCYTIVP